ncbi:hypothetical protein MAA5396_03967 [Marinovum algicola]|uniref:3-methylfumaryl-CoA hydratase n=1 Tax=Marinovum algicola TaxID=42444 RepID=A0A975ZQU2_9RHOB|nr:MaoC family dehydratase N-terminal domain-containing protein [Marinovum algicola]SEK09123.1 3-methylfumaryl-CoA hydratase [Marinovum algicola]SLN71600.1 hypothetical protein MAA5396_03967 [Marinovum algicola]
MQIDIDDLRRWIGREEHASEALSATRLQQYEATLEDSPPQCPAGTAPPLIHWCLAQPVVPMSELGRDGHPALGSFLPPVPLPRRMWAGGEITFHDNLRVGNTVDRCSKITDVTLKQGRSGDLCFVTVTHDISTAGRAICTERQDLVYRAAASGPTVASPAPVAAPPGDKSQTISPHPTLLFRFSALTFNGHRIHYDRRFCTDVEGYAGLVVHGPLQATLLCHFAAKLWGAAPKTFWFRSVSAICDDTDFTLNATEEGDGLRLWTAAVGHPVAMEAGAQW